MQDLFAFQLDNPLPQDAWTTLRSRLAMKSYNGANAFKGIAHLEYGLQAYLISDGEEHFQLVVRAVDGIAPERLIYWRARVAQIAQAIGSTDPKIEEALKRQRPREEGIVRSPSYASRKPRLLSRLLLRKRAS